MKGSLIEIIFVSHVECWIGLTLGGLEINSFVLLCLNGEFLCGCTGIW
jgi:hypothetical protein